MKKIQSRVTFVNGHTMDVIETFGDMVEALDLGGRYMILHILNEGKPEKVIVSCSLIVTIYSHA